MNKIYKEKDIVEGIVINIVKYGVFLSFENNYFGLLHISEISKNFVSNIHSYFHLGDKVNVLIKDVDLENKFLSVSIKDLPNELNPYKEIEPSRKNKNYAKDIDFTKLNKVLKNMIVEELKREEETC